MPDQVMEGDQGWVIKGVPSRASFRRLPISGQKTYGVVRSHFGSRAITVLVNILTVSDHVFHTFHLIQVSTTQLSFLCALLSF